LVKDDLSEVHPHSGTDVQAARLNNLLRISFELRGETQMQVGGSLLLHDHIVYHCVALVQAQLFLFDQPKSNEEQRRRRKDTTTFAHMPVRRSVIAQPSANGFSM
jgi:hypothetical protein